MIFVVPGVEPLSLPSTPDYSQPLFPELTELRRQEFNEQPDPR